MEHFGFTFSSLRRKHGASRSVEKHFGKGGDGNPSLTTYCVLVCAMLYRLHGEPRLAIRMILRIDDVLMLDVMEAHGRESSLIPNAVLNPDWDKKNFWRTCCVKNGLEEAYMRERMEPR